MKTVTEIARFNLAAVTKDEIVDGYKIFMCLLGGWGSIDAPFALSYHANAKTWSRIWTACEATKPHPTLMGAPAVVELDYADNILAVVCTRGDHEAVLTLVFPKE